MRRFINLFTASTLVLFGGLLGGYATAEAQELEPNNSCFAPQDDGEIQVPSSIAGSIDASSAEPDRTTDVDFFRLVSTPGLALRVTTPSFSHLIGLFSEQCTLLATGDFGFGGPRIDFNVPASGVFIVAVAASDDNSFSGNGFFNPGLYTLSIVLQPPTIGSISGRIVDAISGLPLMGAVSPFARVDLLRCTDGNCFQFINSQSADARGMFLFQRDNQNDPIEVGDFMLTASANDFESASVQFSVQEGEEFDAGDLALLPPPIDFSAIQPCMSILPQGGRCEYSVNIRNNTTAPLSGQAHSIVDGGFGGSLFEATTRRSGDTVRRQPVRIPALSSQTVRFSFDVPSFVPNGTFICTELFLGIDPSPLFNVTRRQNLFCLSKGSFGIRAMSVEESRAVFQSMGTAESRPRAPAPMPLQP